MSNTLLVDSGMLRLAATVSRILLDGFIDVARVVGADTDGVDTGADGVSTDVGVVGDDPIMNVVVGPASAVVSDVSGVATLVLSGAPGLSAIAVV